jgi:hypothetical protein
VILSFVPHVARTEAPRKRPRGGPRAPYIDTYKSRLRVVDGVRGRMVRERRGVSRGP